MEASYVGNRGTHIEITRDINAIPNKFLSTLPTRDATRISYLTGSVANPFAGLGIPGVGASSTISRQNLMKPFPEFGTINTTTNDGYSWYHAAQIRLEKRFAKGYTLQASFTHSKFMQATEYLNPADPLPARVISDQDYPNRLAIPMALFQEWSAAGRCREFTAIRQARRSVGEITSIMATSKIWRFPRMISRRRNGSTTQASWPCEPLQAQW